MKILIADDDVISQILLSEQLRTLGHEVFEASDGHKAWRLYESIRPQVVITDWMMPKIDGLELTRMIRAEKREIYTYIICLTILHGKGSFLEAMASGADDFVTKPFDTEQLVARLHAAERILGLQHEVKQLQDLLSICSYCKKIKEDDDTWVTLESYISKKTETSFSHGICPDCYQEHVKPTLETIRKHNAV
jgi:sigma-B regulation protein RsbU (phosphoserine phosphatase)